VGEKIAPIDLSQEAVTSFNGATILSDDDLDISVCVCVCVLYIKETPLTPQVPPKKNLSQKKRKEKKRKRFHHPFLRFKKYSLQV